jgi:hypothetical protein
MKGNEPFNGSGRGFGTGLGRSGKQWAGKGDGACCNDAFDKLAPRHSPGSDFFNVNLIHFDSVCFPRESRKFMGSPGGMADKLKKSL